VVETCTGDPVYVMFKCEFTVQQNPEVTDNITLAKEYTLTVVNCVNYRPVLAAQECLLGMVSSPVCAVLQTESDDPSVDSTNMSNISFNVKVNYICRENVEGILHINRVSDNSTSSPVACI